MRQVPGEPLWIGNLEDVRDVPRVLSVGVRACIDLALNEAPVVLPRELASARFPLLDGPGNPPWMLRSAIDFLTGLLRARVTALVFGGAGMSRAPAIAAVALARARGLSPADALALVVQEGPAEVNPGLWRDVVEFVGKGERGGRE